MSEFGQPPLVDVEKPLDHLLIHSMDIQPAPAGPTREVGDARQIFFDRVGRVTALLQILSEAIDIGRQLALK